jgi:hypothetical protein
VPNPHTYVGPVNVDGTTGRPPYTVIVVPEVLPQPFTAITLKLPDTKVPALLTCIAVVPLPDVIVSPVGTVHVYDVAPNTGATEYCAVVATHMFVGPVIAPVAPGFLVMYRLCTALVPQLFLDATVIFPITVPAGTFTVIEVPVFEAIVIGLGTVHK